MLRGSLNKTFLSLSNVLNILVELHKAQNSYLNNVAVDVEVKEVKGNGDIMTTGSN